MLRRVLLAAWAALCLGGCESDFEKVREPDPTPFVFPDGGIDPTVRAADLEIVSGNDQSTRVNSALAQPLVVRALDAQGDVLPEAEVTFEPTGGFSAMPARVLADAEGLASTQVTSGDMLGNFTVSARSGGASVVFQVLVVAGEAVGLRLVSTPPEQGVAGQSLPSRAIVLRAVDSDDNPVPEVRIIFDVRRGEGSINPAVARTDDRGEAEATAVLDAAPGVNIFGAALADRLDQEVTIVVEGVQGPVIEAIDPPAIFEGQPPASLQITGRNFAETHQIFLGDTGLETTFLSEQQLRASLAGQAPGPGAHPITVRSPEGLSSGPTNLEVLAGVEFRRGEGPPAPRTGYCFGDDERLYGEMGHSRIADLDGDGRNELVSMFFKWHGTARVTHEPELAVHPMVGERSVGAPVLFRFNVGPEWMALGDFEGDGDLDVFLFEIFSGGGIHRGTRDSRFLWPAVQFMSGKLGLAVGDVDADGDADVLVRDRRNEALQAIVDQGATEEAVVELGMVIGENDVFAFADLDEDGRPDLLHGDGEGLRLRVLKSSEGPSFEEQSFVRLPGAPRQIVPLFADDDLHVDLLVTFAAAVDGLHALLLRGSGQGGLSDLAELRLGSATSVSWAEAADLNSDRLDDLALVLVLGEADDLDRQLRVLVNTGNGALTPVLEVDEYYGDRVGIGDLDHDGWPDLVGGGNRPECGTPEDLPLWWGGPVGDTRCLGPSSCEEDHFCPSCGAPPRNGRNLCDNRCELSCFGEATACGELCGHDLGHICSDNDDCCAGPCVELRCCKPDGSACANDTECCDSEHGYPLQCRGGRCCRKQWVECESDDECCPGLRCVGNNCDD